MHGIKKICLLSILFIQCGAASSKKNLVVKPTSPRTYPKILKSPTSKFPAMVYAFLQTDPTSLTQHNVNAQNECGLTLLHLYAQNSQNAPSLDKVLSLNPGINTPTEKGNTPLHVAVLQEDLDKTLIFTLVEKNADLSVKNKNGLSVIDALVNSKKSSEQDRKEVFAHLKECKKNQDQQKQEQSADFKKFMSSMFYKAAEDAFEFIQRHPTALTPENINATNARGETIAHLWVRSAYFDHSIPPIQSLIELKADVNACDLEGNTPMHHLFENWHLNFGICQALVNAKADVTIKNKYGQKSRDLLGQLDTHKPIEVATLQFYLDVKEQEKKDPKKTDKKAESKKQESL